MDILEYANSRLLPTWEKGDLFYLMNNTNFDEEGDWVHMDPFTGNAAIGYTRLNMKSWQNIMWERSWTCEMLVARPWIDELSLSEEVDYLRPFVGTVMRKAEFRPQKRGTTAQ